MCNVWFIPYEMYGLHMENSTIFRQTKFKIYGLAFGICDN